MGSHRSESRRIEIETDTQSNTIDIHLSYNQNPKDKIYKGSACLSQVMCETRRGVTPFSGRATPPNLGSSPVRPRAISAALFFAGVTPTDDKPELSSNPAPVLARGRPPCPPPDDGASENSPIPSPAAARAYRVGASAPAFLPHGASEGPLSPPPAAAAARENRGGGPCASLSPPHGCREESPTRGGGGDGGDHT